MTETTDGRVHHRDGAERNGPHPCVVISTAAFNDFQSQGLIVVSIMSAEKVDTAPHEAFRHAYVRIITKGEPSYVVEQVRYIDRSRCRTQIDTLLQCDLKQVEDQLKQLLFP
jgi:mRNA-degrading endonuclease toxin of MazEF toxin-antitoxin module